MYIARRQLDFKYDIYNQRYIWRNNIFPVGDREAALNPNWKHDFALAIENEQVLRSMYV